MASIKLSMQDEDRGKCAIKGEITINDARFRYRLGIIFPDQFDKGAQLQFAMQDPEVIPKAYTIELQKDGFDLYLLPTEHRLFCHIFVSLLSSVLKEVEASGGALTIIKAQVTFPEKSLSILRRPKFECSI